MTDEELTLGQELVNSLDGTCLHEWDLNAAAAACCIIVTHPDGRRFSISFDVRQLAPLKRSAP